MTDQLNLFFGPQIPQNLDCLGIAFISGATYNKDNSVAGISAERYVKENYDHVELFDVISRSSLIDANVFGSSVTGLNVSMNIPQIVFNGTVFASSYTANSSTTPDLNSSNSSTWLLRTLNSTIKVLGVHVADNGSWYPIIQPGVCWRLHTGQSNEPQDSWIRASWSNIHSSIGDSTITSDVSGQVFALCYSIPENQYAAVSSVSAYTLTKFPYNSYNYRTVIETALVANPSTLKVNFSICSVSSIYVNGISVYSGFFDGSLPDTYLASIEDDGSITLNSNLSSTDVVVVTYNTLSDFYVYTGYRSNENVWYPLDLNPEYGHFTGDWEYGVIRQSLDCLNEQVTIYLQPSSLVYPYVRLSADESFADIKLYFDSAFNYGETHFVRHIIRPGREQINPRQGDSPVNTYGHAIFGRNYYDEGQLYNDDTYSDKIPSMMPIGKFILSAPLARQASMVVDVRQRGGGVPLDYQFQAVDTQNEGVDTLRGYYDLGIWSGKGIQKYGIVEFRIDPSVLNNFTQQEINSVIESQLPPGTDYVVNYTTV